MWTELSGRFTSSFKTKNADVILYKKQVDPSNFVKDSDQI